MDDYYIEPSRDAYLCLLSPPPRVCVCSRLAECLEQCLPRLESLTLTNNSIEELVRAVDPLPALINAHQPLFCLLYLMPTTDLLLAHTLFNAHQEDIDPLSSVQTLTYLRCVCVIIL